MPVEAPPAPATAPAQPGAIPTRTGPAQVTARPGGTSSSVVDMGPKYPLSGGTPKPDSKPGDAKKGLFDKIASKAKPESGTANAEVPPEAKPEVKPGEEEAPPAEVKPGEEKPATEAKPEEGKAKEKVNPWKLIEKEYKPKVATLEKEVTELKKLVQNPEDRKKELEIVKSIHDRNKQLEDEIRYVRYEQSTEFKEKYDQPYVQAWQRGMKELEGIQVDDGADGKRAFTAEDMLTLVNLPAGEARRVAREAFGDDAEEVLAQRRKIRELNDSRMTALEEARTKGAERDKQRMAEAKNWNESTNTFIKENWDKVNSEILESPHGEYFKQREGDPDWNQRLAKGFELVDRAFNEHIKDPKLTAEQRAGIIRRHAAVRNRAAGWGPLKYENGKLKAKMAELEKELASYKGTTPDAGGRNGAAAPARNGSAMDALKANIAKRARVM